jgi:hypothetical protein
VQADFEVHWSAMIAPGPIQMESQVKVAPTIPRLKITAPVMPQHQGSRGGDRKPPFTNESSSLSSRENLRSPLLGFDHGVDFHGKHALQFMASPFPKDYSFPSTSGHSFTLTDCRAKLYVQQPFEAYLNSGCFRYLYAQKYGRLVRLIHLDFNWEFYFQVQVLTGTWAACHTPLTHKR